MSDGASQTRTDTDRPSMWRTFVTPRWLALFGVLIAIIVVFAQLGLWQMSVARDDALTRAYAERAELEAEPVEDLLEPYESFPDALSLAPVEVSGEYDTDPDREFLIPERRLDGEPGYWVATRLDTGDGAWIAGVRGFVTDPADVPPAPEGPVQVDGVLAPGESPSTLGELPDGQRGSLDLSALINEWPGDPYNAFVFVQDESPATELQGMQRIPPPVIGEDVDWRNLGYAMQWWVFAAFAAFMYWKFLRDARLGIARGPGATLGDDGESSDGDGPGGPTPPDSQPGSGPDGMDGRQLVGPDRDHRPDDDDQHDQQERQDREHV